MFVFFWSNFWNQHLVCGICSSSADDAESAAQGERWCMQQIVAAAAFLAAEADNSDGFRLKAPQIPSRPTREQPPVSV